MTSPGPYGRRQIRADQLVAAYPHAAEMLGLYRQVLALQEPLHDWVLASEALVTDAKPPGLGLDRLPFAELSAPFRTFAGDPSS